MGNYASFRGCGSRQSAARPVPLFDASTSGAESGGTQVEAKYRIPLFWMAGFSPDDLVIVQARDVEPAGNAASEATASWSVPCAPVHQFVTRARARRGAVLSVVPAALGDCYDEWIRFVERRFTRFVMIETSDLFSMTDPEEASLRLRGALRALQASEGKVRLTDTAALDWFAQCLDAFHHRAIGATADDTARYWRSLLGGEAWIADGTDSRQIWPTRPTAAEVAHAASLPEAPLPGSEEDADAAITALVRTGVQPENFRERLRLVAQQATGDVPRGVDAPTRGLRKGIAGAHALLSVVRNSLVGFILAGLGLLFTWAGVYTRPIYWYAVALGGALLLVGGWLLRSAWRGRRQLRAILRA